MDRRAFSLARSHARGGSWPAALGIATTVALLAPLALVWLPHGDRDTLAPASNAAIPWTLLAVTVAVAATAAALAVVIGGALAVLLVLTPMRGPSLWATAALVPFICPPVVWALAQIYCYGPGGMVEQWTGDAWRPALAWLNRGHYLSTVLVLAQIQAPLAMLMIGRGLARLHQSGLEAAVFYFRRVRLGVWVAGAVRREIASALLLTFALGLGSFAAPHVLQCRVYSVEVYTRMTNYLDERGALAAAAPLLAITLAAAALLAVVEWRGASAAPQPQRAVRVPLGRGRFLAYGALLAWLGLTVVLPLAALLRECQSPGRFLAAVRDAAPETENTLAIAGGAAAIAGAAGLAAGVWAARSGYLAAQLLTAASLGVPALIVGLAYVRFYNRAWPVDLTAVGNTSLLVMLGLAARGWPFAARAALSGRRRLAPQWLEAAQLGGLGPWRRTRRITAPLMLDYVATGAIIAFVLAASEVEISQLLCAPGSGTLALRLFTFLHFGPTYVTASLALLQLVVTAAPVLVYFLLSNRCPEVV